MGRALAVAYCSVLASGTVFAEPVIPTHVACVGDSITSGAATTYPGDLQELLGAAVQVANFGHSGATMMSTGDVPYQQVSEYEAATSFAANAGLSAVVDVIIMLGTNDTKPYNWTATDGGTPAERFRADCAAMVDHFRQLPTHPRVFLALPPEIYPNSFGIDSGTLDEEIVPILRQVAVAKGVPTIDVNGAMTGHAELFSDGVHPNDQGYSVLARVIEDALLTPDVECGDVVHDAGGSVDRDGSTVDAVRGSRGVDGQDEGGGSDGQGGSPAGGTSGGTRRETSSAAGGCSYGAAAERPDSERGIAAVLLMMGCAAWSRRRRA